ncbi:MAG TPA: hemerythrin domain-containing protein [Planctomycetota bacterium]|nr:hemerythrin domain-containing protein [Planctomycetota bacterium]
MKPMSKNADSRRQIQAAHRQITALTAKLATVSGAGEMVACLRQLGTLMAEHFADEEQEFDGLHENIRSRSPELQNALHELAEDHKQLLERVDALLWYAQQKHRAASKLRQLGKQFQERLARHEARETGIFQDSIWTDLGTAD